MSSRSIAPLWINTTLKKNVALMLDEWGTWWDTEPGTNPGHLYQQNTLRDAFVASLSFDIFHKYTDRLKMANIAQIVNVLQSMILTSGKNMVLTPTYYVFKMYNVHQDATYIPLELNCDMMDVRDNRRIPNGQCYRLQRSKRQDTHFHVQRRCRQCTGSDHQSVWNESQESSW